MSQEKRLFVPKEIIDAIFRKTEPDSDARDLLLCDIRSTQRDPDGFAVAINRLMRSRRTLFPSADDIVDLALQHNMIIKDAYRMFYNASVVLYSERRSIVIAREEAMKQKK